MTLQDHSRPDQYSASEFRLGVELLDGGHYERALGHFKAALAQDPGMIAATAGVASCLERLGRVQEGLEVLNPLLAEGRRDTPVLAVFSALALRCQRADEAIGMLRDALEQPHLDKTGRINLNYALGRLLDHCGDYDAAFSAFAEANRLKRNQPMNPALLRQGTDNFIRVFDREFFRQAPRAQCPTARPIFIVGMPRSGSSLVEQILACHPGVSGGGELELLPALASQLYKLVGSKEPFPMCVPQADTGSLTQLANTYLMHTDPLVQPGSLHVTDKLPGNFLLIGLIELLFPNASIIHVRRHPLDNCLSCHFENFTRDIPYTHELAELGQYWFEYHRLMQHWRTMLPGRMFELDYENLVRDQEAVTRALLAHCGLEWDARCLEFHRNARSVGTASYDQVRRPMYSSSIGRWRHYERHLGPLRLGLGDCIPASQGNP